MRTKTLHIFLSSFILILIGIFFVGIVNAANPYCSSPTTSCNSNNYTCPSVTGLQKTECCLNAASNCICKISWTSGTCGAAVNGQYYGNVGGGSGAPATTHCLRPDVSRWKTIDPTVSFLPSNKILAKSDGSFIVAINSSLNISGYGEFNYFCDNGWSPLVTNYFDVYDNINHKIIATNGLTPTSGPDATGTSPICSRYVGGIERICYINGCGSNNLPCTASNTNFNYMVGNKGECSVGSFKMGVGKNSPMIISLSQYTGEQDWSIRLGAISPGGVSPDSPYILPIEMERIKFAITTSSMLVFSPKPVEKINSFENNGLIEKEIYFTLLNKSRLINRVSDYNITCPNDVNCTVEMLGVNKMYKDFTINPNSALMIPVSVSFNKNNIPRTFSMYMTVAYASEGFSTCTSNADRICHTTSSPVTFESGYLDKQDFQINVKSEQEQKYCVDSEGNVGQTGPAFAPRVNLYFGGNVPPLASTDSKLVSLNECSPIDYNTLSNNPNWVYCSAKEFFVQLGARLGKYGENISSINALEQLGRFSEATKLREENGRLLGFNAYLRETDLSSADVNSTVNSLKNVQGTFMNLGFNGEVDDINKLNNLIKGIRFVQTIGEVEVSNTLLSPGQYKIIVDINAITQTTSGDYLFNTTTGVLNEGLNIKVRFEKVSSPGFNWFFYYNQNESFAEEFANPLGTTKYTTNVINRGVLLNFEKDSSTITAKNFYPTFAVPLVARIKDRNQLNVSDSEFKVVGYDKDVFTYWTAFASSLADGCETTSANPLQGSKVLPYRVNDYNLGNTFYGISEVFDVNSNSTMYLSTVLYLPTNDTVNPITMLLVPFKTFTKKEIVDGNALNPVTLSIDASDPTYSAYKIESLENVLNGINDEKVCVIYDKSTGTEKWNLFWNQDKVLDSLKNDISSQILTDAKICESRALMSS